MILVTGNLWYIGAVMTEVLQNNTYRVAGLDNNYYESCQMFPFPSIPAKQIIKDVREVTEEDLEGIEAVVHLAALSNDPLGELNPSLTENVNHRASVKLAQLAKKAGVKRFIFSSSCSLYGIAPDDHPLNEGSAFNPITVYARTKAQTERDIALLADEDFHPVFMRNATVYGLSPSLRLDLVVNNLLAAAFTTGKISILSDGTPWRPIIHVRDFCHAFFAMLQAPVDAIHNRAFNVGLNEENYQVKDIARRIERVVPNATVEILNQTGPDERTYRVDFSRIKREIPGFKPAWNVDKGIRELHEAYQKFGLTHKDFQSPQYFRVRWIKHLLESKRIDTDLKWQEVNYSSPLP